jgi:anthranilate synthase/aminodeoxychorismate synthase-like glutamine amidotransferase
MICVIDNYDSFTYNLVQILRAAELPVEVYKNDQLTLGQIKVKNFSAFLLSPGPGSPSQSGVCPEIVREFYQTKPIFGVCLGHQVLAEFFGAKVQKASRIMHGKISEIYHDGEGVYRDMPNPFRATRYHSLIVEPTSLPSEISATSWTRDETGINFELMGLRHREFPLEGVQFHPESIMTSEGQKLVINFFKPQ